MADAFVLEVQRLVHRYGATPVLDDVDLTVAAGELVAVLGASGSGKTTLLRAIAGLVTPTGGTVRLSGATVASDGTLHVPVEARRIGLVFQDYALFGHLSVAANIAYGLPGDPDRVDELMERVGLAGLGERRPAQLSGGQQQRVALARALAPRPRMLLLDEPFANVDADRRDQLAADLRSTLASEGRAALLVTHDRASALGISDRIVVLVGGPGGGRVGQIGAPEHIYAHPASEEVARLTGPCCVLDATASEGVARCALGAVPCDAALEGAGTLLLRPEALTLIPDDGATATVRANVFRGNDVRITVDTPAGTVVALHPRKLPAGSTVAITLGEPAQFVAGSP
ncbi:MAG: ABC transporter ATP-binding protein [Myxococcales bacterium]|nr:ABC transporter ATP-binding protein [Myxococcales bacterium]